MSDPPDTFLDVEDDDQRQKRIGSLLERLDTTSPSTTVSRRPHFLNIGRGRPRGPVEPPTEPVLARVQAFLPAIAASNTALSRQNPQDIDIEHVAADESRYIEMNLGLGIFEAKRRPDSSEPSPSPSSEAESTEDTSESESESYDSASEQDEDDYSSSDSDGDENEDSHSGSSVDMRPVASRPVKPLPGRAPQQEKLEV